MGIAVAGVDVLSEKAAMMRESLQKSQTIADNVVTILGSFDHRLSALETAMRPTQIRTHSIRKAHENIDRTLKAAEVILAHFDQYRQAEAKILKGPHEDLENYLQAIENLRSNIQFFGSKKGFKSSDGIVVHANNLLAKAISKLEDEFRQLLLSYSKPVEPERLFDCLPNSMRPSSGSPHHEGDPSGKMPSNHHSESHNNNADAVVYTPPALIPPRFLPLLHDLAQQMVEAGHQQQLLKIYRDARSNVLEESLQKLGVEKLNKEDVQKLQWEILEAKIGNWIHFMRIAVKLLFAGERKVCDQIFEGFDSLSEQCFAEVTKNSVSMLLSFGEAIAKSKRSPEKLFVLLDMYEIMQELHSEIETLFKGEACSGIREAATGLTKRLAQTAQDTFGDFEEAVEKDATKTAVTDGTVHPLTSYVINYVKFLFDYQSTLKQLFQEFEGDLKPRIYWETTGYNDTGGLCSSTLINTKEMPGQRFFSAFLFRALPPQVVGVVLLVVMVQLEAVVVLQEQLFKAFNVMFEELHQKQSQWTVPDTELRESLRLAVAEVLLPAYRSFVKRFGPLVESGKNPQKYIKYTAEDLDRMLGEFFEGKNMSETKR
ncbi:exocyst complex component 7 [Vigna unguiculata]|uniref:Exocyst subunit Exo70 family protein n=1 Tax=Vigna unguiculata TaxID=3917 RepID=A0A4D6N1U5_VIGUN|nr:exocyst complex component 7 [Vigna unguiculata]